jgi:hypothetical protein
MVNISPMPFTIAALLTPAPAARMRGMRFEKEDYLVMGYAALPSIGILLAIMIGRADWGVILAGAGLLLVYLIILARAFFRP